LIRSTVGFTSPQTAAAPPAYTSTVKHLVKAGVALTKGQAVYVTGSTGNSGTNMIVGLASNAQEPTSSKTMGLIESSLAINGQGYVITEGLLAGLNTNGATAGDPVWLGVNGNLIFGLANKPKAPDHLVFIGIVTRAQQNNGEIFVKVQNGFELEELHNLVLTDVQDGDAVVWDSATSKWINQSMSSGSQGTTGAQGAIGTSGATGAQGTIGAQGAIGTSGATGAQGTTGAQGIQGSAGEISGSANQVVYKNASNVATGSSGFTYDGTDVSIAGKLNVTASSGNEGGEIFLNKAAINTSINGGVTIDVYQNRLRIFEQGGDVRGAYLDITKLPTGVAGELLFKSSGFVNAGVDVTLGNLKARIPTSGNRSLQLSTITGTYSLYGSDVHSQNGVSGGTINEGTAVTITTTPTYLNAGYHFATAGATQTWILRDVSSTIAWRITMVIGGSYNNNFISIERL
jgi:hypothetical protein